MNEERNKVVYRWYVIETGHTFYVGSGTKNRANQRTNGRNDKFLEYINNPNITCAMEIEMDNLTKDESFKLEEMLTDALIKINECDACKKKANKYINKEDNPMFGHSCTEFMTEDKIQQWKENKSKSQKKFYEEHSEKKQFGKNNPMYGHSVTEFMSDDKIKTWKENISKANSGKNNGSARAIVQLNKNTGDLIKIWDYIKQASDELKINRNKISSCCRGKIEFVDNFIFKYLEDYKKE